MFVSVWADIDWWLIDGFSTRFSLVSVVSGLHLLFQKDALIYRGWLLSVFLYVGGNQA